ncbi:YbdD/YjiX family protein [Chitiniphilus purpureus]|uniref:YbdD/YjiX family protein n=1 Tax=Chitiniphilus purpureus TaxID=2981137 RepID=A0ABY6DHD2_9NEIS|nr:YbdD/YjiX family protein [Chitiniphilus sp. CD1]UXY13747.1 YbdD/YjiX family protein [Chitiniphilus sp. CD1]
MPELIIPGRAGGTPTEPDTDEAYARYLAGHAARHEPGLPMSRGAFERYSLGADWLGGLKDAAKKLVQTCRLMVGIHDYEYYLAHMQARHPDAVPLSREAFYRHCLEARFPGADAPAGARCPC